MPPRTSHCKDTGATLPPSWPLSRSPGLCVALGPGVCRRPRRCLRLREPPQTRVERATQGRVDPRLWHRTDRCPGNAAPHAVDQARDRRRGRMQPRSAKRRTGRLEPRTSRDSDRTHRDGVPCAPIPPGQTAVYFGMDPRVDRSAQEVAGGRPTRKRRQAPRTLCIAPMNPTRDRPDPWRGDFTNVDIDAGPAQPTADRRQDTQHRLASDRGGRHAPEPQEASATQCGRDRPGKPTPQALPHRCGRRTRPHDGRSVQANLDQDNDHDADTSKRRANADAPKVLDLALAPGSSTGHFPGHLGHRPAAGWLGALSLAPTLPLGFTAARRTHLLEHIS